MSKLLKLDLSRTYKKNLLFYGAVLAFFILFPILIKLDSSFTNSENELGTIISSVFIFCAFLALAAVAILIISNIFKYIHKTTFSSQGYLTFTTPYKTSHILLSKIIVSVIWILGFIIVSCLGVLIMLLEGFVLFSNNETIKDVIMFISEFVNIIFFDYYLYHGNLVTVIISFIDSLISIPVIIILYILAETFVSCSKTKFHKKQHVALAFIIILICYSTLTNMISNVSLALLDSTLFASITSMIFTSLVLVSGFLTEHYLLKYYLELV